MPASVGQSQLAQTSESEKCWNPPWWNRRTKLERTLCLVTVTSLLMLFIMAAALGVFAYLYQENIENSTAELCLTPGCVKAAAELISNLDESVDPCDDFYKFACGGWITRTTISDDRSGVSVLSQIQDDLTLKIRVLVEKELNGTEPEFVPMLKMMYDSCMDLKTINKLGAEPLKKNLEILGGWPVVEGSKWSAKNFDWVDTLIKFRKLGYDHDVFIDLSVKVDTRNNNVYIIEIDQGPGISDKRNRGLNDSSNAAYFKLMMKSAKLLGANENTVESELMEVFQFEIDLANITVPREQRRNISMLYNLYTVEKLVKEVPAIPWLKYFNGLLNNEIFKNETVKVSVPDFISKFAKLITSTEKRVIANYMAWQMVYESIRMMSKEWRDLVDEYSLEISGRSKPTPRWETCLNTLTGNFGVALSSYYVRNYFKEESKEAALEMVKYIHKEFQNILENIDWMEEKTKKHALAKAATIKPYIGYPKEVLNDTAVLDLYGNMTIRNDTYFDNVMRLRKWSTDVAFSRLRHPSIKGDWKKQKYSKAAIVNAFYNPVENSIEFPAGILQNMFFSKDRPHYMNFGAIGYVIGHEITHGFDDKGRQFDKDGNNVNWWDETTDELFKQKKQCIIDQYSNYTIGNGMKLNGVNTQGENIADNGGLKEAYWAYRSWVKDNSEEKKLPGLAFTQNQLFWISAANSYCSKFRPEILKLMIGSSPHSPDKFRVIGPMSNLPEFAKDFNCSPDSAMNKKHKCKVW